MQQFLVVCALLLCATFANAQAFINGTVANKNTGEALPYVTIKNLTTNQGTVTNGFGQFTIEANQNTDQLEVSYLGYDTITVKAVNNATIQLAPSDLSINEVVVSYNREQTQRTEAPVAISSITTTVIEDNKPTTISEVLNQTAGVNMVDLGNEQHSMSIRRPIDFGASYLYLEDGVPIRTSGVYNHNALLEINMANTSKVEIIRGPASSLYGSEAIGGAVNFISKRPTVEPTGKISLQGNDIGYRRVDFSAGNTFNNKLGVGVNGYYANQKDGVIEHSDFDKLALSLQAIYKLSEKSELNFNNTYVDYYSDMTGSLDSLRFFDKDYKSAQTFTNRKADAFRSKLALNHYWNDNAKTTATGYYRNNSMKQNPSYRVKDDYIPWKGTGDRNLAHGEQNDNSFKSYGFIGQHKQNFNWLNSHLVAGASIDYSPNTYEANYIRIHKTDAGIYDSFEKTDSLLADYGANLTNAAAYLEAKVEPLTDFNFIVALRYDNFNYKFDNNLGANAYTSVLDGKNNFHRVTPKVGATYDLGNTTGLYANYSQGYVPPQVGELYRGQEIPTLKPVTYDNKEVGAWVTFANEKAKFETSIYKMDGTNEIVSVLQDNGSRLRMNVGETTHYGVEYNLNVLASKDVQFRLGGTNAKHKFVTYNDGKTDLSDKEMPNAPNWLANGQVTFKPEALEGFRTSVEWQHVGNYYMDQANTKTYDGHDVFNVRLGYDAKKFELWMNMMNFTDQLYSTSARSSRWGDSYSLGKPRNTNIGFSYKFSK